MKSLFLYKDYRVFLQEKIQASANNGYGVIGKLAKHLASHSSLISQILSGKKSMTMEQAFLAADFFSLSEVETEYFILLIQIDRAGHPAHKLYLEKKIDEVKKQSLNIAKRMKANDELGEEAKAKFYSDWTYSALRQATSIPGLDSVAQVAQRFQIPRQKVRQIFDFLVSEGLVKEKNGKFSLGLQNTHLPSSSPWIKMHHLNWRQKALSSFVADDVSQVFYSCPLTISKNDGEKIREMIVSFLEEINQVVDRSPSEEFRCLNIDWFKF